MDGSERRLSFLRVVVFLLCVMLTSAIPGALGGSQLVTEDPQQDERTRYSPLPAGPQCREPSIDYTSMEVRTTETHVLLVLTVLGQVGVPALQCALPAASTVPPRHFFYIGGTMEMDPEVQGTVYGKSGCARLVFSDGWQSQCLDVDVVGSEIRVEVPLDGAAPSAQAPHDLRSYSLKGRAYAGATAYSDGTYTSVPHGLVRFNLLDSVTSASPFYL